MCLFIIFISLTLCFQSSPFQIRVLFRFYFCANICNVSRLVWFLPNRQNIYYLNWLSISHEASTNRPIYLSKRPLCVILFVNTLKSSLRLQKESLMQSHSERSENSGQSMTYTLRFVFRQWKCDSYI